MRILRFLFALCVFSFSYISSGNEGSASLAKVLKASEVLNGKLFAVSLFTKGTPDYLRQKSFYNPISHSWLYTERMEVRYGGKKIDIYPESYLNLFDPTNIHSIEIAPNRLLSFQVKGADASSTYNYRFYVDPNTHRLVRVDHVWPEDGVGGVGVIEKYKTKPIKIKRYLFKDPLAKN
jgi:hypothetical protein